MIRLILVMTLFVTSSCALFRKHQDYAEIMQTYLAPTEGRDEKLTSEEIKKVLTKDESMAGGNYKFKITPISDRLVKAYYKEMSFKNGLTAKEQEDLWKKMKERYMTNKTCLHFEYEVIKHQKAKELNSWKLQFKDRAGQLYPVTWNERPLFSMPAKTKIQRSGNLLEQWIYEGTGCTDTDLPLEEEFAVHLKPAFVQWPFSSSKTIWWEFDRTVKGEEGEEKVIKKKKRTYQRYRGW